MADKKHIGKTAPDLGRSNMYDSAGDGKTFHLSEIPKWRLGNSYSAGFDYFSNAGENIADSEHGISESRKPVESYDNRGFIKSTKSLSATRDTKTAVSSSTRLDQSADYTDDESSSSSNGENHQDEQMLTWRKMLLDPLTAGQFLSKQWPRISLRASYTRKEPYVAPDEEDADLDFEKEENDTKRRRKCTIYAIISGILLVVIAIIPVIVITNLLKEQDSSKLYVRVNMTAEVDRTFTQTFTDSGSQDYKSFTDEFCYEIGNVYNNNSLQGYHGCKVSSLKNGSISVNYIIYFTGTPLTDVESEAEMILNDYLNVSSSQLGPFVIKPPIVVYSVSVEILTTPPTVQGVTAPNSISSSLELSLIETSGIISTLESTSLQSQIMSSSKTDYLLTMETTIQFTESLQSEQQTTKNSFSSSSETTNFAAISTTVPIAQTESVTLIKSSMQTLILSSEPSMSIDHDQVLTTTREYLESESNFFELSTSDSFEYTPTDALSNGVSLIFDTSVDITTMIEMTMTSSGLSGQTDNMQTFSPTDQTTTLERTVTTTDDTLSTADLTIETTASTILLTDESTVPITTTEITQTTDSNIFETHTTPKTTPTSDNTTTLPMTTNTTEKEISISQTSEHTTTYSVTYTPENVSTSDIISSTDKMSSESTETTSLTYPTSPNTSVSDDLVTLGSTPSETTTEMTTSSTIENTTMTSIYTEEKTTTLTTITTTNATTEGSTTDKTTPTSTVFSTEKSTTEVSYSSTVTEKPTTETTDLSSTEEIISSTEGQSFVFSCNNITSNLYSGPEIMTCTIGNAYDYNQIGILRGNISAPLFAMAVFRNGSTAVGYDHPDITVFFDKSTTLTVTFRNISDEILGNYDILLINSSGDAIAETQGFLSVLIHELSCTNISDAKLYFGPFAMICIIPKFETFDYIGFYHAGGLNNSLYGILVNKNGSIFKTYKDNRDIEIDFETTSSIFKLMVTFKNVSCAMDGFYSVALVRNVSNILDEITSASGHLQVTGQYEKPTLTLNADQVIDLIFPINFYRDTGFHTCEGNVGYPTSSTLKIDIMYINGTNFQQIPDDHIYLNANRTFGECQTMESLKFAVRFTEDMDGAKLRCSVADSSDDYTSSENLTLIPRNICDCGGGAMRGHPKNCKVQVLCIEDSDETMYPWGIACQTDLCRNSLTGECSNNCSDAVCQEEVPQDFCTTPAPPTTTPIPSAYIVCNDSTAPLHSGPVDITCILNETTFTMINVTFISSATSNLVLKATMNNNRNVTYLIPDDNFSIRFESEVLTISIKNATCSADGIYGITIDFNDFIKEEANGKLTISRNPGKPLITMHTDQIVDLGYYRDDRLHTCTGDVGVPSTHLIIELVYANGSEFQIRGDNIQSRFLESGNCSNSETVKFGISFTSEMNGGKVKCSINGSDANATKNEIDLALIPRDICSCGKHLDTIGHPQSCYAYVLCEEKNDIIYPFGISCPSEECRNSITGMCSSNCSQAVCGETVPSGFCTTPAPMLPTVAPSQHIQCYGNSTLQFSGKVQIVCVLNQTEFSAINVTFVTTKQSSLIAQIASNRTVKMVETSGKIDVQIFSKTVTVELLNASCIDSGLYVVAVDLENEIAIAQGQLYIQRKPDKPTLDVPFYTVENEVTTIICTGNTGSPAGSLQILINRLNVSDTITLNLSSESVEVIQKPEICNHEETVTLRENLTSDWNLTTIKCQAVNQETITEGEDVIYYTSEESQIVLVEETYCPPMSTVDEYKYHPKSCSHYVRCAEGRMYQYPCPTTLCFSFNATYPCASCEDLPDVCSRP